MFNGSVFPSQLMTPREKLQQMLLRGRKHIYNLIFFPPHPTRGLNIPIVLHRGPSDAGGTCAGSLGMGTCWASPLPVPNCPLTDLNLGRGAGEERCTPWMQLRHLLGDPELVMGTLG